MDTIKTYNTNLLIKIRSKHILRQIQDNLKENRWLEIIKYNKIIQNIVDININHYKKIYQRIEIELFPSKFNDGENNLINISNIDDNKSYYHIYFNKNKKEAKRTYFYYIDNITKKNNNR